MELGLVDGLNKLSINVWAMLVLFGGILLTIYGYAPVGSTLITGGFALLRTDPRDRRSTDQLDKGKNDPPLANN